MVGSVEGEWGKYAFKRVSKENYLTVIKHLEDHFHDDEPLAVIVGNSARSYKDLDRYTSTAMDEGVSLAAYDTETQKLAGVAIVSIARKNQKAHFEFECESEEQATILRFMAAAEDGIDIFEKYGVEEYAELLMISIDREFRGEGLATEFHTRIFEMLKETGIKLTAVSSSSPYTRKILERMGFEEVSRKYFREMLDTSGRVVCPNAEDHEFLVRLVLRMQ